MVSTDVLEEGMDITTCNLVIRFDEITTFRLASFDFTRFFPFLIFHRYLDRAARYIFGFKEVFKYYLLSNCNFRSYVQSKGRARAKPSQYIVLVEAGKEGSMNSL